jgi:hypothetical protein
MSRFNSFIVGTLLGDSYVRKVSTNYTRQDGSNGAYYALRCEQTAKDLIDRKAAIWERVFGIAPSIYVRQRKSASSNPASSNTGTTVSSVKPVYSLVLQSKDVADYYRLFYRNKKKVITKKTLFHLDAKGIAHWIMDDGLSIYTASNSTRRLILCTDGFDLFGCKLICQYFSEKYQVSAKVQKRTSPKGNMHYRVKFGGKDAQKLAALVFPYMLPSFYSKIFFPYDAINAQRVLPEYREIYTTLESNVAQRKALQTCNEDIV